MCDQTTTKICDYLQSLAIETTEKPSFGEWMRDVQMNLENQAATGYCQDRYLQRWYNLGFAAKAVAEVLDKRYKALKPTLFPPSKVQE
jgi:hypothetical protein